MRCNYYDGSGWKFNVVMIGFLVFATIGLTGCGGGGGGGTTTGSGSTNFAPAITSTAPTTAVENVTYTYLAVATDSNSGDILTWSLSNQPVDMTIDSSTGLITWIPPIGATSSGTITLRVTDSGGLSDTQDFNVTVEPAAVILPPVNTLSVNITSFDLSSCPTQIGVALNVLDENGIQLTDNELNLGDFTLTDNSVQATLNDAIYTTVNEPLSIALVLDESGSLSANEKETIHNAVVDFINNLASNDAAEVIKFKDTIAVMQAFTTNKQALAGATLAPFPNPAQSGSVLYEAIVQGIWDAEVQLGRRAVIAITDGDAQTSPPNFNLALVLSEAARTGIPVYTIGISIAKQNERDELVQIADDTGGTFYEIAVSSAIFQAYDSFKSTLDKEWVLTFGPTGQPNPHDIEVGVTYSGVTGDDTETGVTLCP